MHRNFQVAAEFFEPHELVVDEGFERPEIERLYGRARVSRQLGNDRQKRGFCLTAGGLSCDDEVAGVFQNLVDGLDLDGVKFLPTHRPDGLLHSGMQEGERAAHQSLKLAKSSSLSVGGGTP